MPDEIRWIELNLIDLPARGRQHDPERVAELARDMAKNGQLQDIIVAPKEGGRFEVVAGRGRYLAAQQLKWEKLQCLVKENLTEADKLFIMIAENDEREDVSPIDRGLSYTWAMEAGSLSQEALGDKIGKTHTHISQYVLAAKLPEPVQAIANRFAMGIAFINQLVRLAGKSEAQLAMAQKCAKEDLSVKQLETLVTKALKPIPSPLAGEGGGEGGVADAPKLDGFKISKSGKRIHIIGDYQEAIPPAELGKALEAAYQQWKDKQAKTNKINPNDQIPNKSKKGKPVSNTPSPQAQSVEVRTPDARASVTPSPLVGADAQRAGEGGVPSAGATVTPSPLVGKTLGLEGQSKGPEKGEGGDEGGVKPAVKEETIDDIKRQANQQAVERIAAFKDRLKTPEGRFMVEAMAKAMGFETPEAYIAKLEEDLKK